MLRNEIHIHLLFRLIVLIRRLCPKLLNNNDNNKMHGSQSDGFPNDPMFIQLRRLATELCYSMMNMASMLAIPT